LKNIRFDYTSLRSSGAAIAPATKSIGSLISPNNVKAMSIGHGEIENVFLEVSVNVAGSSIINELEKFHVQKIGNLEQILVIPFESSVGRTAWEFSKLLEKKCWKPLMK
jgi:hypothetical protein